jgi:hypothetical protein
MLNRNDIHYFAPAASSATAAGLRTSLIARTAGSYDALPGRSTP